MKMFLSTDTREHGHNYIITTPWPEQACPIVQSKYYDNSSHQQHMRHQSCSMYYFSRIYCLGIILWEYNSKLSVLVKVTRILEQSVDCSMILTAVYCSGPFNISFIRSLMYSIITWRRYNGLVLLQRRYLQNYSSIEVSALQMPLY